MDANFDNTDQLISLCKGIAHVFKDQIKTLKQRIIDPDEPEVDSCLTFEFNTLDHNCIAFSYDERNKLVTITNNEIVVFSHKVDLSTDKEEL